jgi:predicted dithiol-disulfide oxidoreductase (DUF899 family)
VKTAKGDCLHCSFWADNFNGIIVHLNQRDVTMIAISRASCYTLAANEKRMGWNFKWASYETDFNFDYNVSFKPEENGNVTGFKITRVHPIEGVTTEVSFTSEIRGEGRFPSGKNLG